MKSRQALLIVLAGCLWMAGCAKSSHYSENLAKEWRPARVAVLPYQLGVLDTKTNRASSAITGAIYRGGEIIVTAQVVMDQIFRKALDKYSDLNLVEQENAGRVLNDLRRQMPLKQAVVTTGRQLGVDAVIIGCIYRFSQRMGSDFSVETPASAAFDLCVIRVADGAIVWRHSFDHTQTALSENLLDAGQFIARGLRWFKVEEFAQYGVEQLMEQFPWRPGPQE